MSDSFWLLCKRWWWAMAMMMIRLVKKNMPQHFDHFSIFGVQKTCLESGNAKNVDFINWTPAFEVECTKCTFLFISLSHSSFYLKRQFRSLFSYFITFSVWVSSKVINNNKISLQLLLSIEIQRSKHILAKNTTTTTIVIIRTVHFDICNSRTHK